MKSYEKPWISLGTLFQGTMLVSSIKLTGPEGQPEFTAFMQQQEDLSPTAEITGF